MESEADFLKINPIPSMGLVYLPTWMADLYGKCRCIYHTSVSYGVLLSETMFLEVGELPSHQL